MGASITLGTTLHNTHSLHLGSQVRVSTAKFGYFIGPILRISLRPSLHSNPKRHNGHSHPISSKKSFFPRQGTAAANGRYCSRHFRVTSSKTGQSPSHHTNAHIFGRCHQLSPSSQKNSSSHPHPHPSLNSTYQLDLVSPLPHSLQHPHYPTQRKYWYCAFL